jgi:hypothetical protein
VAGRAGPPARIGGIGTPWSTVVRKGSSPGRSEGIGGGQYSAGMTYGLFGKLSARPGRRDDLVTYLLKAAKLPQRAYEIAGPR